MYVPMAIKRKGVALSLLIRQSHMTSYHTPRKWRYFSYQSKTL